MGRKRVKLGLRLGVDVEREVEEKLLKKKKDERKRKGNGKDRQSLKKLGQMGWRSHYPLQLILGAAIPLFSGQEQAVAQIERFLKIHT